MRCTRCLCAGLMMVVAFGTAIRAEQVITVANPMAPPAWALMERELLRAYTEKTHAFADTFLDERGYLLHTPRNCSLDGPDDAIETFAHWTLLPSLGADESVYKLFLKGQEGHLRQYREVTSETTTIARNSDYYMDFRRQTDWLHNGEGLRGFFFQPLYDPTDNLFQKRIRRFADFYTGENPDVQNYDPEVKIIRSIFNGSDGPLIGMATVHDWMGDPVEGKFNMLHSNDRGFTDFMESYDNALGHFAGFLNSAGDHPLNLATTMLSLNAYMLNHETKYRDWVLEYVDAWKERIDQNGGNIPSNIGLDGTIGGQFGGKWYGGTYGWDFTPWDPLYGRQMYHNTTDWGMWTGFGNAYLITGDRKYLDVLRRQMDNLYAQKKVENGQVLIPRNYGLGYDKTGPMEGPLPEGHMWSIEFEEGREPKWYNYSSERRLIPRLTEIYMWSMDRKDLERIPREGWIGFLEGTEPDYPERELARQFENLRREHNNMRNDRTTIDTRLADWPEQYITLAPGMALNRLMQGGYLTGNFYVLHCRARYFDPARSRAGLPEDVAALVTGLSDTETKLTLVNINQITPRDVIVQASGYGEHQCQSVTVGDRTYPVNDRSFRVRLAPGAGTNLTMTVQRYTNQPTLAFPWHGDTVPTELNLGE
jgi:hypothetical protein